MALRKPIVFVTYNRDKDWYEIQNHDRELIVAYSNAVKPTSHPPSSTSTTPSSQSWPNCNVRATTSSLTCKQ